MREVKVEWFTGDEYKRRPCTLNVSARTVVVVVDTRKIDKFKEQMMQWFREREEAGGRRRGTEGSQGKRKGYKLEIKEQRWRDLYFVFHVVFLVVFSRLSADDEYEEANARQDERQVCCRSLLLLYSWRTSQSQGKKKNIINGDEEEEACNVGWGLGLFSLLFSSSLFLANVNQVSSFFGFSTKPSLSLCSLNESRLRDNICSLRAVDSTQRS